MSIKDHLSDIDFRSKAERQKAYKADFLEWWKSLITYLEINGYDERVNAQKEMLQAVLWYLLDDKEYKTAMSFTSKQAQLI